jgi:hypothetical protein
MFAPGAASAAQDVPTCLVDRGIPAPTRASITSAAAAFADDVLSARSAATYDRMSVIGKAASSPEAVAQYIKATQLMAPYAPSKVTHIYLVREAGNSPSAICGNPDARVDVRLSQSPVQSFVLLESRTRNAGWALTIWMEQVGGVWQVNGFNINASIVGEATSGVMMKRAREQAEKHNDFNAAVLYATGLQLAQRGPVLRLGVVPGIQTEIAGARAPKELSGAPPFAWDLEGKPYRISQVGTIAVGGEMGLDIQEAPLSDVMSTDDMTRHNQAAILSFLQAHPEVRGAFPWVNWRSLAPDGKSGLSTVYDFKKGFL